jgi:pimeloyl-ACP methyl ester carboxylesterase
MSTWILLRGLMRETRHWGEFPALLREHLDAAEVIALDLPGNGRLHRLRSPLDIAQMAEHCRRELSARGIAPPYHVLGLSMGAMVAVAWGARHPQELRACVLINSSLRRFDPFYRRLRPGVWQALPTLIGGDAVQQERAILRLTSSRGDTQSAILETWLAYRRECPVTRRNALRQLIAAARYRAPALRPAMPVLVLSSARDALVHPCCSRHLAERWQASLAIHPDAGHDLPLDDAAWVARQISAWLAAGACSQNYAA